MDRLVDFAVYQLTLEDQLVCADSGGVKMICLQFLAPEKCACGCSVVLTLFDPVDCGLPDLLVRGILEARMLEWVAMPSSRGSSPPRDQTHVY